jgi:hypothetical protein
MIWLLTAVLATIHKRQENRAGEIKDNLTVKTVISGWK